MRARRPGAYRQPCEEDPVMLELGLKEKVAIITGGSEGLGRAAAEKLAAEGARVAICARRKEVLDQAADEIRKATGCQVLAQVADVSRAADCEGLVNAVVAQWGGVDILLNNAGGQVRARLFADHDGDTSGRPKPDQVSCQRVRGRQLPGDHHLHRAFP